MNLKHIFLLGGYNDNFLEKQFLRAANISRINALQTKPKASNDVLPFVVTYNPALPRISNILRKHFNILHSSNRCTDVFKQPPFVVYRRSSNLRDLLVKAQLPVISTNHFPPGSFRCGQNCATCPYITNGLTSYTYTFYATGETRSITSPIIRNTKNVIYMVQCNRCNLPYIGETKRRLKDRFNEQQTCGRQN